MVAQSFKERVTQVAIEQAKIYEQVFLKYEYLLCSEAFSDKPYYRERAIVSEHLGFCPECFSDYQLVTDESGRKIKQRIKPKAFIDIAYDHGLASPSSADRIYRKALQKLRKAIHEKTGIK